MMGMLVRMAVTVFFGMSRGGRSVGESGGGTDRENQTGESDNLHGKKVVLKSTPSRMT
jgi:hypothetical protein